MQRQQRQQLHELKLIKLPQQMRKRPQKLSWKLKLLQFLVLKLKHGYWKKLIKKLQRRRKLNFQQRAVLKRNSKR